jgi:hypothetical protein
MGPGSGRSKKGMGLLRLNRRELLHTAVTMCERRAIHAVESLGITPETATGIPSLDGNRDALTCIRFLPVSEASPIVAGSSSGTTP